MQSCLKRVENVPKHVLTERKRQSEVAILESLKGAIDDFDLGVHSEIELIGVVM